jgi:hypothetical protein
MSDGCVNSAWVARGGKAVGTGGGRRTLVAQLLDTLCDERRFPADASRTLRLLYAFAQCKTRRAIAVPNLTQAPAEQSLTLAAGS